MYFVVGMLNFISNLLTSNSTKEDESGIEAMREANKLVHHKVTQEQIIFGSRVIEVPCRGPRTFDAEGNPLQRCFVYRHNTPFGSYVGAIPPVVVN